MTEEKFQSLEINQLFVNGDDFLIQKIAFLEEQFLNLEKEIIQIKNDRLRHRDS